MGRRRKSGQGRAWIGTSGWIYRHWAGGVFYPPRLAQRQWLPHYIGRFDTVEINASFYRLPTPDMARRWAEAAPARFRYSVKLWRMATHMKRLKDCSDQLARFLEALEPLKGRRGPLLVQLPPNMTPDPERLEGFLSDLGAVMGRRRWKVAVEFRGTQWLAAPILEALDRHGAALVLHDMRGMEVERPNDAGFVYVRRHGASGRYAGEYSEAQVRADARRVRGWLGQGRDVWVYYNNDAEGAAVRNAARLAGMLDTARPTRHGRNQSF